MRLLSSCLTVLALAAASFPANAAQSKPEITLKLGKVVVMTADGGIESTHKLVPFEPIPQPITLTSPDSVLKISFTMVDESSGSPNPILPQQAHLMFKDVETGTSMNLPLVVKKDGKAKLDLKVSSLPTSLRSSSGTHLLTLLLSSPNLTPLKFPFLTLTFPSSSLTPLASARRWSHEGKMREGGLPAFELEEEIVHTFGKGEKEVGWIKSLVGTVGVWAPWLALLGLLTQVAPGIKTRPPPITTFAFLLSLVIMEGLILKYWIHWKIFDFLPWFGGAGLISAYLGKVALSQIHNNRLQSSESTAKPAKSTSTSSSALPSTGSTTATQDHTATSGISSAIEMKPSVVEPASTTKALQVDPIVRSETPVSASSGAESSSTPSKKKKGKK